MPSGSKKRKSSKKKKKLGGNNNNNNVLQVSSSPIAVNSHSHGEEDLKHGGNKETDGGDVRYSASQSRQFNDKEGTREKQLEIPHSESSIDNNKSNALEKRSNEVNKVAMVEGGIVQVERQLKLEDESMRNNINIERVEPATSNAKPFKAVKDDDKLEISYNVPVVDAGVRANNMEGSTHEHQPLVALDRRPVQTTSWKSCCGLFEVFAASNK